MGRRVGCDGVLAGDEVKLDGGIHHEAKAGKDFVAVVGLGRVAEVKGVDGGVGLAVVVFLGASVDAGGKGGGDKGDAGVGGGWLGLGWGVWVACGLGSEGAGGEQGEDEKG